MSLGSGLIECITRREAPVASETKQHLPNEIIDQIFYQAVKSCLEDLAPERLRSDARMDSQCIKPLVSIARTNKHMRGMALEVIGEHISGLKNDITKMGLDFDQTLSRLMNARPKSMSPVMYEDTLRDAWISQNKDQFERISNELAKIRL